MDKGLIRDYELDIIVKAWRDEAFRQDLIRDPKKAIEKEFSIKVPSGMSISVHEESEDSLHLIVPSVPSNFYTDSLSDEELKNVIGGVIATGHLGIMSKSRDREKIRDLQKEIDQLKHELTFLKKK
jgi:hypothetical protein